MADKLNPYIASLEDVPEGVRQFYTAEEKPHGTVYRLNLEGVQAGNLAGQMPVEVNVREMSTAAKVEYIDQHGLAEYQRLLAEESRRRKAGR